MPGSVETLFVTRVWRGELPAKGRDALLAEMLETCYAIAEDDEAGQRWCADNAYAGYTSYASLDDLPLRAPVFATLKRHLDSEVAAYARTLDLNLKGGRLTLDSLWINILGPGGAHSGHIHPHSVISGTIYVDIPEGASALRLEDPRLPLMMAHPPRRTEAAREMQTFVSLDPAPGTILLWESFLRHEVPMNGAEEDRVSISFNYRWG